MAGKHDQIAGSLIQDILSGRYQAQDRLPSERDLSTRFDANRGAVREALKKLEFLGFIEIQPGGARVNERSQASLDALGHMLEQGDLPDPVLVDQTLLVISNLVSMAAEQTLELADTEELESIRKLLQPLLDEQCDEERHLLARIELTRTILLTSNNLPLQMIARSLSEQLIPNLSLVAPYADTDRAAYASFARNLDRAIEQKDAELLRSTFSQLSNLNRQTVMQAIDAAARANVGIQQS